MKKIIILVALILMAVGATAWAEDFLGAPLMPGGSVVRSDGSERETVYDVASDQIVEYYRQTLADQPDIKTRRYNGYVRIEDYGRQPWHKIVITPGDDGRTTVVVTKDSWTWILGMLTLRFTGVFVVLLILFVAMTVTTAILSRTVGAEAPGK